MNPIASTTASSAQGGAVPRAASSAAPQDKSVVSVAATRKTEASSKPAQPVAAKAQTQATAEEIQRASEDLRQRVNAVAPELQFSVDETSGRSIIKFTDRATNEVIRQFPSEEALALTKAMDQFQRGLIFNRKA